MSPSKLHVTIRTITGKEIPLDIEPQFTILQIKELIEADSGIPPDQQWLIVGGRKIDKDPKRTAADCKIEDGATLNLVLTLRGGAEEEQQYTSDLSREPYTMQITVRKSGGGEKKLDISPEDTIARIRTLAGIHFGCLEYGDRLILQGEVLDEERTAASYNSEEGQVLYLEFHGNFPDPNSSEKDPFAKTTTCKFFAKGRCRYGDQCAYLHESLPQQGGSMGVVKAEYEDGPFLEKMTR